MLQRRDSGTLGLSSGGGSLDRFRGGILAKGQTEGKAISRQKKVA